ncbi:putative Glycoside hydrolase family 5 protein [Seiridium cardinale]|uniref:Glycoside hydrolase family 5 protein n=1 Tax=Seiridium cardinale TaxID=138064 RepID=A0ABR2XJI8_9PEZI
MASLAKLIAFADLAAQAIGHTAITVDLSTKYQAIDGFGFSQAFGSALEFENADSTLTKEALDYLFDTTTGAGFSIVRNRIGSNGTGNSIEPTSPGSATSTPTYAVSYGVNTIYADAWSAPGFMKTSASDQLAGYSQMQISTNGQEAIDFIPILYDTLQDAGVNVAIACCDALGWNTQSTYTTAFVSAGVIDDLGVITSHAYSYDAKTLLNQTDLPKWNTEAGPSSAFATTWYSSGADNEGFTWANKIAVAMEGFEIEETQSGLHLIDTLDGATATPSGIFWAFAMWSRYIRPGAVMLGTSGSIHSVITGAFQNTKGSIILMFTNSGTSSQSAAVSFTGFTAGSASAWLTSQGSTFAATEATLSGGTVTVSIPAKGVVTIKLTTGSGSGDTTTLATSTTSSALISSTTASTAAATTTASSCSVAIYGQCAGQSYKS